MLLPVMVNVNYYTRICRDIPYTGPANVETSLPVSEIQKIAGKVIEYLNDQEQMIKRTNSERCVAMLLRAKWFLKTGSPMLAPEQSVSLTREEWDEINELCDRYHSYHDPDKHEPFVPAYFLKGVYEWIYGSGANAKEWFEKAKNNDDFHGRNGDYQAKSLTRLVLCVEGTKIPRTFRFGVQQKQDSKKYTAKILQETTTTRGSQDFVATRYGLYCPDPVVKYLFDGSLPREQEQHAMKEGSVCFNLIGAQVGVVSSSGGHVDEQ